MNLDCKLDRRCLSSALLHVEGYFSFHLLQQLQAPRAFSRVLSTKIAGSKRDTLPSHTQLSLCPPSSCAGIQSSSIGLLPCSGCSSARDSSHSCHVHLKQWRMAVVGHAATSLSCLSPSAPWDSAWVIPSLRLMWACASLCMVLSASRGNCVDASKGEMKY